MSRGRKERNEGREEGRGGKGDRQMLVLVHSTQYTPHTVSGVSSSPSLLPLVSLSSPSLLPLFSLSSPSLLPHFSLSSPSLLPLFSLSSHLVRTAHVVNVLNVAVVEGGGGVVVRVLRPCKEGRRKKGRRKNGEGRRRRMGGKNGEEGCGRSGSKNGKGRTRDLD